MSIIEDLKLQFKIGDVLTKLLFWNIAFFAIPSIVFGILPLFKVNIDLSNYVQFKTSKFKNKIKQDQFRAETYNLAAVY